MTAAKQSIGTITAMWPTVEIVDAAIPARAKEYLTQSIASLHAPVGAIILAASAVDAMLKDKSYSEGSLNSRIDQAAKDHLVTSEMATWAHEIRLDANELRHADPAVPLPNEADARKVIAFVQALGQFLYVLPARVERGRKIEKSDS